MTRQQRDDLVPLLHYAKLYSELMPIHILTIAINAFHVPDTPDYGVDPEKVVWVFLLCRNDTMLCG